MPDVEAAQLAVHKALGAYLEDNEIAVGWVLTIEVLTDRGVHGLCHRAGGGMDGSGAPTAWAALGMLQASSDVARDQMKGMTWQPPGGDGGEQGVG